MQWLKDLINWLCQPHILFTLMTLGFLVAMRLPALWSRTSLAVGSALAGTLFIWS